ncbi:hypothetical protein [Nocardiopsis rhodophaea]|uniref:hypothetical protein n=1 Tax=Nocardiopsis rhodophaea TaxID=280238 RepID=UPI0031DC1943
MIEEVTRLAADFSILAGEALKHRANAHLGQAVELPVFGVRVDWASIQVDVAPEDVHEAEARMRLSARAKAELEDRKLRIAQAVTFRDLLRDDPSLALGHLLLYAPDKFPDQAGALVDVIAERVAAHAPGAAWVKTAQLLEEFFGKLPSDEKKFIIDRICRTLTGFGAKDAARQISQAHQPTTDRPDRRDVNGSPSDLDTEVGRDEPHP